MYTNTNKTAIIKKSNSEIIQPDHMHANFVKHDRQHIRNI